ncbi:MAG: non-homologous end-joining DNA ligase [Armatimonadota bacterium]
MKIGGHEIDISSRDKVFFPDAGYTKGDVIDYYETVADVMVPHMKRYGVSMQRFPDGLQGGSFYNKDTPDYFPDWINTVNFPREEGGSFNAPIVDSKAALVYMADQAVLTPHLYLARTDDLRHPDRMIYDLDPPEGTEDFSSVREAALDIRSVMDELDLMAWLMTTGSKGYHLIIPLDRSADFDEVRQFAHDVALVLVRRREDKCTLEQRKNKRTGRVFLDVLRNSYGATTVAPYAIRARAGAPVATPISWDELEDGADPQDWTIESIPDRLARKEDPWAGMMRHARSISSRRDDLDSLLDAEEPADEED